MILYLQIIHTIWYNRNWKVIFWKKKLSNHISFQKYDKISNAGYEFFGITSFYFWGLFYGNKYKWYLVNFWMFFPIQRLDVNRIELEVAIWDTNLAIIFRWSSLLLKRSSLTYNFWSKTHYRFVFRVGFIIFCFAP